jgi:hypothetical protein
MLSRLLRPPTFPSSPGTIVSATHVVITRYLTDPAAEAMAVLISSMESQDEQVASLLLDDQPMWQRVQTKPSTPFFDAMRFFLCDPECNDEECGPWTLEKDVRWRTCPIGLFPTRK